MRLYHDWEFLELGAGHPIQPISVGMVSEAGDELYYEFFDAPWTDVYKHEWLKENVVPHLTGDSKSKDSNSRTYFSTACAICHAVSPTKGARWTWILDSSGAIVSRFTR